MISFPAMSNGDVDARRRLIPIQENVMKFMATWNIPAAHVQTAKQRFVKKGGLYGDVKLLGQWHSVNGVEGWSLVETDSAMAINAWLDS